MTSLVIEAAVERARTSALVGNAAEFNLAFQSVQTLDRDGEAPMHELRMLALVAAARLADLQGVETTLESLQPLSPSDWKRLRHWLVSAPEMQHANYIEFIRELDRRTRQSNRMSPMRRWTPALAIVLIAACVSLLLLSWRLSPTDPSDDTRQLIIAVLDGSPSEIVNMLPRDWESSLRKAVATLAQTDGTDMHAAHEATNAAMLLLANALRTAAASPQATSIAERLVGPRATAEHLKLLAQGVELLRESPWLNISLWKDGDFWRWKPDTASVFALRTLLRHAPLSLWMPGLFSSEWRCDPRLEYSVFAHETARSGSSTTVRVQIGSNAWFVPTIRIGRRWASIGLDQMWPSWQQFLLPQACTASVAQQLQSDCAAVCASLSGWIDKLSIGADQASPEVKQIPWWVQ